MTACSLNPPPCVFFHQLSHDLWLTCSIKTAANGFPLFKFCYHSISFSQLGIFLADDGIFLADSLADDGIFLADSLADDGIFLADSLADDGIFTDDDCLVLTDNCISLLYVSQGFNVILWDLAFSLCKHLNGISGKS
jgi:hypothetical protein